LEYAHLKYLIKRGFDPVITEKLWGVKGISLSSRLAWRLWIPIYYRGELVSWTTRDINDNSGLRYISASKDEEKIPHKNLLYGEDLAHHAIIIHEGPLDAWKTGPGGVAIMGLLWTPAQFQKMIQYPVRVVCFDNEIEAQKRADKLANELKCYPGETHIIQIESGEDVAAASEEEVAEIRDCFLV